MAATLFLGQEASTSVIVFLAVSVVSNRDISEPKLQPDVIISKLSNSCLQPGQPHPPDWYRFPPDVPRGFSSRRNATTHVKAPSKKLSTISKRQKAWIRNLGKRKTPSNARRDSSNKAKKGWHKCHFYHFGRDVWEFFVKIRVKPFTPFEYLLIKLIS